MHNPTNTPQLPSDLLAWIRRLAFGSPQLADLSAPQLEQLAQVVVWSNLRDELKRLADLNRIDYPREKELFLQNAGRSGSAATRRAYTRALDTLEAWCRTRGLTVPEMKPRDADEFLYAQRARTRAGASIRLDAAGAGAFFSFLERRHDFLTNPFRGSRARPPRTPSRVPGVPSSAEVEVLIQAARPELRAVLVCLSSRGLRVGALPTLVLRGSRFSGHSKGKAIAGSLPAEALEAIAGAGLNPRRPFAGVTAKLLACRVRYHCRSVHRAGLVSETFSSHDFRHFFAVTEYHRDKDLYRLRVLLGHWDICVTERYLRSIQVLD